LKQGAQNRASVQMSFRNSRALKVTKLHTRSQT
jgi:hypothetical protein